MGRSNSFQYQKRRPAMTSPYSFEQPVSQFASLLSPTHQSPPPAVDTHPAVDAQLEYAHLSGPTLDQISVSPPMRPTPAASAQHVSQALQEQKIAPPENHTGLPDALKTGIECLSGFSLDDVRVHYNSSKPAEVDALAYTQGSEIYMGPGQEQHLAHEAWHVVQQMQERVKPTRKIRDTAINDDQNLEAEASSVGTRATSIQSTTHLLEASTSSQDKGTDRQASTNRPSPTQLTAVVQRYTLSIDNNEKKRKTSKNESYITDEANESILYVEAGATPPKPSTIITNVGTINDINGGKQYHKYKYTGTNFINDCLGFAENLARGTEVESKRAEFHAVGDRPGGRDRLFGHLYKQNAAIADPEGGWAKNEGANPEISEAYAISRTVEPIAGETPYHVAAVVAKDLPDNITLEADAGEKREEPIFDMYDTTPPGQRQEGSRTFHEVYKEVYTSKRTLPGSKKRRNYSPSTGVLRLRKTT